VESWQADQWTRLQFTGESLASCDDILMFTNETALSIMSQYCNYFSLSYANIQNYFKRAFYQELHHIIFNKSSVNSQDGELNFLIFCKLIFY